MISAFYDEEIVQLGDDTLRLAIDFGAIDLMEHIVGNAEAITPAPAIVQYMLQGSPIPISVLCKVLYALLRRHHENISLDVAMGVIGSPHGGRVTLAMQGLLKRAFNFGEPGQAKDENPRERRGASVIS